MERLGEKPAKIVATLPCGDHMMIPFLEEPKVVNSRKVNGRKKMLREGPEADKLTGFYSPLFPCLYTLAQRRKTEKDRYDFSDARQVDFISVDRAEQIEVAARILAPSEFLVASEPSALVVLERSGSFRKNWGTNQERALLWW